MKKIISLIILSIASMAMVAQQQSVNNYGITKKLHIENDGFVWYEIIQNGKHGANSVDGKTLIPTNYSRIYYYCKDKDLYNNKTGIHYFEVEDPNEYVGIYTREGTLIIPTDKKFTFAYLSNVEEKWCWSVDGDDDSEGLLDIRGKEVISTKNGYENVQLFKSYTGDCPFHILIYKDGYSGLCDLNGNILISPNKYKEINVNYNELKVRLQNNSWKQLAPIKIDQTTRFDYNNFDNLHYNYSPNPDKTLTLPSGQTCDVKYDGKFTNVYTSDKKQLIYSSRNYKQIDIISDINKNWCMKVSKSGYSGPYGLVNKNGVELIPCEMESIESAGPGFLKFKINGFWGVMNYQGKTIIPTSRGYTYIGNYISSQKRFPYTMYGFKGECDYLGRQVSKIKAPTNQQSSNNNSSTASSNKSNAKSSESQRQTIVVEHHRDPVPVQEWQQCQACFGSGQCSYVKCGGSGWYYVGDNVTTCSRCHGNGKCTICAGKGGHYITVYR